MAEEQLPLSSQTAEMTELIEAHRRLVSIYGPEPALEHDTYSLAQPSPFPFVPTVASNQTAPMPRGQ